MGVISKKPTDSWGSIQSKLKNGDFVLFQPGVHPWLKIDLGVAGERYNLFGKPGTSPIVTYNPVGGSQSVELRSRAEIRLTNLYIQGDDAYGISQPRWSWTEPNGPTYIRDCTIDGQWDVATNTWKGPKTKWGYRGYHTPILVVRDCVTQGIPDEHAWYEGGSGANIVRLYDGNVMKHCGRTAIQLISRVSETPRSGPGVIYVTNNDIEDVCLEQGGGGSAFTIRGGMRHCVVVFNGNKIRQGCTPGLHSSLQPNITGAIVVDIVKPGTGQVWWDSTGYSVKSFSMFNNDIEVGTVYGGSGSAPRPLLQLSRMEDCQIGPNRIWKDDNYNNPYAAVIDLDTIDTLGVTDPANMVANGKWSLKYSGVWTDYANYSLFHAAVIANPKGYSV